MLIIKRSTVSNNATQYFNLLTYNNTINKITKAANIGLLAEELNTVKAPISIPKKDLIFCGDTK
ncbi:hypothetical protein CRS_29810 [Chryseobacterium sp. ON_d1]|nr:hypothetical protein CRS_29810 [Chryseobacterium sp. ON_d1]